MQCHHPQYCSCWTPACLEAWSCWKFVAAAAEADEKICADVRHSADNTRLHTCTEAGQLRSTAIIIYTTLIIHHDNGYLSAEFIHRVRCAFEMIMVRKNISSIPGFQLSTEDCSLFVSQLLM